MRVPSRTFHAMFEIGGDRRGRDRMFVIAWMNNLEINRQRVFENENTRKQLLRNPLLRFLSFISACKCRDFVI